MKTIDIVKAYRIINDAKLTKMEDADKFKVIKATRQLKPVAASFDEFVKEAQERLKPEGWDDMQKKARQWQEDGDKSTLTVEERREINRYFTDYNAKVEECVKEEAEKEHELTYERLSEEVFGKFVASNDYDVRTIIELENILV